MKRLFIALDLQPELPKILEGFLEPYKNHPALQSAKWVKPENQHITALFLGEVQDRLLPELRELTRGVCGRMQPFSLMPQQVTLHPRPRGRMLWLRYQKSLAFEEFVGELKRFLTPVLSSLKEEEKDPLPHVTLARLREAVDSKTLSFKPIHLPSLEVSSATLYESDLQPEGSSYTLLERFPYGF